MKRLSLGFLGFTFLASVTFACGSSSSNDVTDPAPNPPSTSPGNGSSGGNGNGNGTDGGTDASKSDASSCTTETAEATAIKPPVDLIFSVDQSGSMTEELAQTKQNINQLSSLLQNSAIDYRVVMVGEVGTGSYQICVPPPLGGPSCTSNGNVFRAVNQHIESTDTLSLLLTTFDAAPGTPKAWKDFLRGPEALKVFVPITDDNAYEVKADAFDTSILAKGGPAFGTAAKRNYAFYPIIGANAYPAETVCTTAVNNGSEYLKLAKLTGGKWFSVCAQNFGDLFKELGQSVAATVACELTIPATAGSEAVTAAKLKKKDGTTVPIAKDTKDCSSANGWQLSADGKKIILCGTACEEAKKEAESKVVLELCKN